MRLFKNFSYLKISLITVCFFSFKNLSSMNDDSNVIKRRKHVFIKNSFTPKNLEESTGQELNQIIVGSFEDHQLMQEKRLDNIVPGKTFPKEIWFEIIDYLDFNDPALVYFFAPIMGVNKEQAEKIAFAIHNFIIKKSNNFIEIDLKLKNILKCYNKKAQELISNYISLIDTGFDSEYKNLKYSVGPAPIRWLSYGPLSVQKNIEELKKASENASMSCYNIKNINSGFELKIKDDIQDKDINNLKRIYSKIKKRILMYEYFGSKKCKKILDKYRGYPGIIMSVMAVVPLCVFLTYL